MVSWNGCLSTDEENVNFARQDGLNRIHDEEDEVVDLSLELGAQVQDQNCESQVRTQNAQSTLITTWEAGWNVTNAIQVTWCLIINYVHLFILFLNCFHFVAF